MDRLKEIIEGNLNNVAQETIDENTYYNITMADGGITNAQMTQAISHPEFFNDGDVYQCVDSGTYALKHFYKFTGGTWVDVTPNSNALNIGDLIENVYVNNHIDNNIVDDMLENLTYDDYIEIPGAAVGSPDPVVQIPNTIKQLISFKFNAGNNVYTYRPVICAADMNAIGTAFGISGGTGYAIVAFYGSKMIYLSEYTATNASICQLFGMTVTHAGFQGVEEFNIYDLFTSTYQITPDFSTGDYFAQVTGRLETYGGLIDRLVAKIPFTFYNVARSQQYVNYTITSWSTLSSSEPYTYSATVTSTLPIENFSVIELINNQAVLFGTYGFVIGAVSGQNITIYSIGEPSSNVTLTIGYGG